jgi:DNA helicase-2/ATP-dependent DNA helicase PcrA
VRFLSHLFGQGHCVTAVGDPNQAIYGWRSASSQTLATFAPTFIGSSGAQCQEFSLLTTWRNDKEILNLANRTIDEINSHAGRSAKVDRLQLRPKAGPGQLICGQFETLEMEAAGIADYFEKLWNDPARFALPESQRSSFAVLVRTRKYISGIESALRARGIPVEVVGLGGLIHIPEIADILALVRTLTFPDAGSSLMRLLTGPRLALGPRDLAGLGKYARSLTSVDGEPGSRSRTLISLLENGDSASMEADDFAIGSAIEALESIEKAPAKDFSPEGLARLIQFAADLKSLRRQMGGSITDVLITAERFLFLDTEVLVRDGWESGRKHLDKFLDEASKFQRNGGTLSSFLEWLKIAENEEGGLKPSSVDVTNSAVQILTVHSSKGSEWDVVAIPGFVKGNFPSSGKSSDLWLKNSGSLPIALRGDSSQLQDFEFPRVDGAPTFVQVKKALEDQGEYWKSRRYEEELRLAYVAFTRARSHLICTASWFGNGQGAINPSDLYSWIAEVADSHSTDSIISSIPKPDTKNPTHQSPRTVHWPVERPIETLIRQSAELVRSASAIPVADLLTSSEKSSDVEIAGWFADASALLTEIESRNQALEIYLPHRLSVSTLIALKENPDELALSIRRPMPGHIDQYARRGTEFHLWVEKQFTDPLLFDDSIFDLAPAPEEVPLKELQDKWRASEWGDKRPIDVEVPFETVMAGHLLRGRIDAIYQEGDTYTIVDWKTGRAKSGDDLATAAIQLAMYRLAYSKLHSIPLEKISAAFHYVGDGQTVRPADIYSEEELIKILEKYDQ